MMFGGSWFSYDEDEDDWTDADPFDDPDEDDDDDMGFDDEH